LIFKKVVLVLKKWSWPDRSWSWKIRWSWSCNLVVLLRHWLILLEVVVMFKVETVHYCHQDPAIEPDRKESKNNTNHNLMLCGIILTSFQKFYLKIGFYLNKTSWRVVPDETACRGDILVFSALFYCF